MPLASRRGGRRFGTTRAITAPTISRPPSTAMVAPCVAAEKAVSRTRPVRSSRLSTSACISSSHRPSTPIAAKMSVSRIEVSQGKVVRMARMATMPANSHGRLRRPTARRVSAITQAVSALWTTTTGQKASVEPALRNRP